jgi:phenylpropionate dioxygenase-like ring-hydroxylating dioxygenase large terminal subunit
MYGLGLSQGLNLERIKIRSNEHVLFKTKDGRISMVDAVCPHRGAKLCNGKVKGNNIQCPYHGWEFSTNGTLMKVPSSGNIPCGGDIQSYPVMEDGGFIWSSDTKDKLPTRYCEELFDPNWVKVYGSRELQGNIYDWILNATDISHINFVHDFADEENGRVRNTKIEMKDDYVDCYANVRSKASSKLTEHMQPQDGSDVHSRFVAPCTSIIRIKLAGPYEFITFSTLLPMDDNTTKMSWCMLYPKNPLLDNPLVYSRFYQRMFDTVAQDEAIIKDVAWVPLVLNAQCDVFQLKALELLKKNGCEYK